MAALAYTGGKREINYYFSVRSAKALALGAVLLLTACHAASRRYRGGDTCEYLLSSGRFLGEKVWQPHSCMMHKYKNSEAKDCLIDKHVVFIGDSRIRQLFYSFIKLINPQVKEEGIKHGNIPFEDKSASIKVGSVAKPHIIVVGAATWSIKIHNGSNEALAQYKINITSIAPLLEKLAISSDVYWVLQDPVYEDMLSESRKMITNEKIDAYNEAAVRILNSSSRNSKAKVKVFSVSKLIAQETIMKSVDGLHLPESSRDTVLFRLNFLVVVLCIVMDRPYQFYYFVPLVTVWFMIIYATLAVWPQIVQKKANEERLLRTPVIFLVPCN
ncbi:CAS1 domain-containing protein 1 isoform X3 [Turdus rufiventris]|nr:CAS1 domain-containing protein 1 isoform X3 [Turdus rufiventris]